MRVDNNPPGDDIDNTGTSITPETMGEADWLKYAQDAYRASTSFIDTSLTRRWERNMDLFRSKHPKGSKYHTDQYAKRSKVFHPKIRSTIRRHEASAAVAYFATQDAVNVKPENDGVESAQLTAKIHHGLLNYRLEHDIPWFKILIGAYQESMVTGTVISCQEWEYKERTVKRRLQVIDIENGKPMYNDDGTPDTMEFEERKILKDRPRVRLVPLENIRIDPSASWDDPINSSPYIIEMIPMYVMDVKAAMQSGGKYGEKWNHYDDGQITQAINSDYDSLRRAREGRERTDSKDRPNYLSEYDIVWVHRNIISHETEDYCYYTLGTQFILSDPKPLVQHFHHGIRPYAYGNSIIEAHRVFPSGIPELGEGLQTSLNDTVNQRHDNVKLVLNRRYYAKRGARIDFRSIMRNVPGSVTLMDDINGDLKSETMQDVTSSSYQEQDRYGVELDEITGGFSSGSVQNNKNMGGTVGGMELLKGDSNEVGEYQLRTFNETWVEQVLKQVVLLEQAYETDEELLEIVCNKQRLQQKFGIDKITDSMLQGRMNVRVNVGFGATQPEKRIQKVALAFGTVHKFLPQMAMRLKDEEVVNEVFGAVGLDGARFYEGLGDEEQNQVFEQLQQQLQQLQQALESKQLEQETRKAIQQMADATRLKIAEMQEQGKQAIAQMKSDLEHISKELLAEQNEIKRGELYLQKQALERQIRLEKIKILQDERDRRAGNAGNAGKVGDTETDVTGEHSMRGGGEDSQVVMNNEYENIPGMKE